MLFFDFRFQGIRCREQTLLEDTPKKRKQLETFMANIDKEIRQGTFEYVKYFPDIKNLAKVDLASHPVQPVHIHPEMKSPLFSKFADEWFLENEIRWKKSYQDTRDHWMLVFVVILVTYVPVFVFSLAADQFVQSVTSNGLFRIIVNTASSLIVLFVHVALFRVFMDTLPGQDASQPPSADEE